MALAVVEVLRERERGPSGPADSSNPRLVARLLRNLGYDRDVTRQALPLAAGLSWRELAAGFDPSVLDDVADFANDPDPPVRCGALAVLGHGRQDRHRERVVQSLRRDADPSVRAAAARALGRLGGAGALEELLAALKDRSDDVRIEAAWALGELGDARARPSLEKMLAARDFWVRRAAHDALGMLGE